MGYKFQFITLAGFHALNYSMFDLAKGYEESGMAAYSELQQAEFGAEAERLHRHEAPARGRHGLLRRRPRRDLRRRSLDRRHGRLDGDRAVPLSRTF